MYFFSLYIKDRAYFQLKIYKRAVQKAAARETFRLENI